MPKMKITDQQLRLILRAEGCDCTDEQWKRRGDHCTKHWLRCRGRLLWKRHNDPVYQRNLAQLGHTHPAHDRRYKGEPCQDCEQFLSEVRKERAPDTR